MFSIGIYKDQQSGRSRWAVYDSGSCSWYFSDKYGKREAQKLCDRLTKTIK